MALKFVQNINLNGLELQNVVLQPLTTAPTTLNSVGRMYFNTTDKKPFWYNGSEFITFPLQSDITAMQSDITTLQDYFTDGKANDSLKLGGVALGGLFTDLSSNTTNAVSVTVGGVTKNITTATLKTSLGLKSLAYKDSLVASDIPAISWDKITANTRPTTIAGYGITDAYTKTDVDDLLEGYLKLIGGTITGNLEVTGTFKIGEATISWDSTNKALQFDKPIYSTGAVSTKGAGGSSGSGGSVDLTSVTSNILPASGSLTSGVSSYSIGSSSAMWKDVYTKNLYVGDVNIVSTISSLQTTVGQHAINIQGLTTSVANIQSTYATISYVDGQINSVKSDIALILDNTSTEAIDSIKEIVNIIGDAGAALVKRYNGTITGNGTMTTFDVTHNLGTTDVIVMVYEVSTMQQVFVDITVTSSTLVKLAFAVAPASGVKYKVIVLA